jgi:hypothetical protein
MKNDEVEENLSVYLRAFVSLWQKKGRSVNDPF